MKTLTKIGLLVLVAGVLLPILGVALPTPLAIVNVTTYYTISKTPYLVGGVYATDSWSSTASYPQTTGLATPIDCFTANPVWSDIQRGLSGRTWGNYDFDPNAFMLDSEDLNFWYAHREWTYNEPDPTPTPGPTATPTPTPGGGLPVSVSASFNYLTIAGAVIVAVSFFVKGRKK